MYNVVFLEFVNAKQPVDDPVPHNTVREVFWFIFSCFGYTSVVFTEVCVDEGAKQHAINTYFLALVQEVHIPVHPVSRIRPLPLHLSSSLCSYFGPRLRHW